MPRVHRVASLLKRWLLGTPQGAVRPRQLDYYLDEFTFRFNRRTSRSRGKLFYRLVQQAVEVDPVHWRDVANRRTYSFWSPGLVRGNEHSASSRAMKPRSASASLASMS